ncbi:hypothetical protein NDU88_006279 [Pleurodeles waltl]|uniref:Uncharacterized protein n=1 Tax=Pleurodeles waltl TaxID=8319 RepID=A0AAV7TCY1_PLEWA|nr:hypothetical protein NDU88_006279 [Pleurodeles waltl]
MLDGRYFGSDSTGRGSAARSRQEEDCSGNNIGWRTSVRGGEEEKMLGRGGTQEGRPDHLIDIQQKDQEAARPADWSRSGESGEVNRTLEGDLEVGVLEKDTLLEAVKDLCKNLILAVTDKLEPIYEQLAGKEAEIRKINSTPATKPHPVKINNPSSTSRDNSSRAETTGGDPA